MHARALAPLVVLALGCSADTRPPPVPQAAPAPEPAPSALATTDAGASKDLDGGDAQRKRLESYTKARARGKELLAHGDAEAAVAAFSEAREAIWYDPVIHEELGYAQLLAGHRDDARQSLRQACDVAENDELGAQAWLHLGMLEEQAGAAEDARVAYAMSQWIKPSAAAVAKLAGRSRCTAVVHRRIVPAQPYKRWDLVEAQLGPRERCKEPCLQYVSGDELAILMLFVPRGAGVLVLPDLGTMSMAARCSTGAAGKVVPRSTPVHVGINGEHSDMWAFCQDDQDEGVACTSPRADPERLLRGCWANHWTRTDLFFDARAQRQVLSVVQRVPAKAPQGQELADYVPPIAVTAEKGAIRIKGGPCDETIPLASLGKP